MSAYSMDESEDTVPGQDSFLEAGPWVRTVIAVWNIFLKDLRTYYSKPPHLSWGIIFPLAWAGMFLIRSGVGLENLSEILPGVVAVSVLFGTTSLLAVTITFEKRGRSFERLLLAPVPLELVMLTKTLGAVLFGIVNAFVPVVLASVLVGIGRVHWPLFVASVWLVAISSAFLGLLVAVTVREVFEAQMLSNLFRFPMLFLCGLFFPIRSLPSCLRPISYALPLTYGADLLRRAFRGISNFPVWLDFVMLLAFCVMVFFVSLHIVRRRWIV